MQKTPNLKFGGELMRGAQHEFEFQNARAFFMLTKERETFGRTTIEAIAKGTPVFAWNESTLPELIVSGTSGFLAANFAELRRHIHDSFDRKKVFESAQKFRARRIVREMLLYHTRPHLEQTDKKKSLALFDAFFN